MKTKALALLLIIMTLFAITSCTAVATLQFSDAKYNLKANDYEVTVIDDGDLLEVGVVEMLDARKPNSTDHICIVRYEDTKHAKLVFKQRKEAYDAKIEGIELKIEEVEYILEAYAGNLTADEKSRYENELRDLNAELKQAKSGEAFGVIGNILWTGTAGALEDATK